MGGQDTLALPEDDAEPEPLWAFDAPEAVDVDEPEAVDGESVAGVEPETAVPKQATPPSL